MLIGTGVTFVAAENESCKSKTGFVEDQPGCATRSEGIILKNAPAAIQPLAQVPASLTTSYGTQCSLRPRRRRVLGLPVLRVGRCKTLATEISAKEGPCHQWAQRPLPIPVNDFQSP